MLRTGIKVSISGVPNVGKSSLLNQLLQNERAIVTSEPGTTRDTVEEKAVIGNLPFVLIDTAGIRNEREILEAEKLGIKRTMNSINNSDIVLVVFDLTKGLCNATKEIIGLLNGKPRIIIGNKIDLVKSDKKNSDKCDVCISAKYGTNLSLLKNILAEKSEMLLGSKKNNDFSHDISINQRQKELLLQCNNSINNAIDAVNKNMPDDIVADELKNSLSKLDEVSGRKINDEIITGIFAKFCIGK